MLVGSWSGLATDQDAPLQADQHQRGELDHLDGGQDDHTIKIVKMTMVARLTDQIKIANMIWMRMTSGH